jgi:hypothetical protein
MESSRIFGVLLLIHVFVIVRYCVGSMVRNAKISTAEYTAWLGAVVLIPVVGYLMYLRWERRLSS